METNDRKIPQTPGNRNDLPPEPLDLLLIAPDEEDTVAEALRIASAGKHFSADSPPEAAAAVETPASADGTEFSAKKRPIDVLVSGLSAVVPKTGDRPLEVLRKCVFLLALITLIGSMAYIYNEAVYIPTVYGKQADDLKDIFQEAQNQQNIDGVTNDPNNPGGTLSAGVQALWNLNHNTRGYLEYSANNNDFLKIKFPVMYSGDNEYYLSHSFYHESNKNGCLFFDYRNNLENAYASNKALIIYGHNMASGLMFTGLNEFVSKDFQTSDRNLANIRSAPTLTLHTLYGGQAMYKVFAVVVSDPAARGDDAFSYLHTSFNDNRDFLEYVDELRDRSLFDFNSVDVNAGDELLVLSTCTVKSKVGFDEGRLGVIARKVRSGESATVDISKITVNKDALMPRAWYIARGETPHPYYTDDSYTHPTWNPESAYGSNIITPTAPQTSGGTTVATTAGTTAGTDPSGTTIGTTAPTQSITEPVVPPTGQTPPTQTVTGEEPTETPPPPTETVPPETTAPETTEAPTTSDTTTSATTSSGPTTTSSRTRPTLTLPDSSATGNTPDVTKPAV